MTSTVIIPASVRSTYSGDSAVVGLYKICENCSRRFFRCVGSSAEICCLCYDQLHRPFNQLWTCLECGMFRAWGTGVPVETAGKILKCTQCSEATEHEFWKVA